MGVYCNSLGTRAGNKREGHRGALGSWVRLGSGRGKKPSTKRTKGRLSPDFQSWEHKVRSPPSGPGGVEVPKRGPPGIEREAQLPFALAGEQHL